MFHSDNHLMSEKFHLRNVLKDDLRRLAEPCPMSFLKEYFFPRGNMFRYVFWFRILQKCKRTKMLGVLLPFVYMIYRHYEFKYQIHGNSNIDVGPGLKIVHGDGVHLNASAIGNNFTCYQGVTLGEKGGLPIIGNNVTIYPGAVVVGPVTLNDSCIIGANAFVNKDIPAGETWGGVPAKKINNSKNNEINN